MDVWRQGDYDDNDSKNYNFLQKLITEFISFKQIVQFFFFFSFRTWTISLNTKIYDTDFVCRISCHFQEFLNNSKVCPFVKCWNYWIEQKVFTIVLSPKFAKKCFMHALRQMIIWSTYALWYRTSLVSKMRSEKLFCWRYPS